MKKFFKILWKIVSWPPLGIASLILGLVFLFGIEILFGDIDQSYFNSLELTTQIVFSDYGTMASICNNKVYVVDSDTDLLNFSIDWEDLSKNDDIIFKSVAFDEKDNLYVYFTKTDDDSISIVSEEIVMFDSDGNYIKSVFNYSYDDQNLYDFRNGNIHGINVHDSLCSFIYNDVNLYNHFVSISTASSVGNDIVVEALDDQNVVVDAVYIDDDKYGVILSDGDIGYLTTDSFECLANSDDELYEYDGITCYPYIKNIYYNDGCLFVRGVYDVNIVYEVTENGLEECLDLYEEASVRGYEDTDYDDIVIFAAPSFSDLQLGISFDGEVYYTSDESDMLSGVYSNSLSHNVLYTVLNILDYSSLFMILYGIIFCFGNFVGWKFSLLAKQLLVTIPLVSISFFVIYIIFVVYIDNKIYYDLSDEMNAFTKACSVVFDGDEIAEIESQKEFVDSGLYKYYVNVLNKFVFDNKQAWSSKYSLSLMKINLFEDGSMEFVELASSDGYSSPYENIYHLDFTPESLTDTKVGNLFLTSEATGGNLYYTADASIFDSTGKLVAVLELYTNTSELDDEILELSEITMIIGILLLLLLILCISLLSKFNVRKLQKASEAVSNIANGDFNSRIAKTGKDEVGQICMNVNDMASKLDVLFKEKDENEQFYYKFVPEQFKELLHKDKFTDLSLGDAESVDLTVLFCDIRSFSLNSEMMTAKENFEFINIIYGKAGPIIRKHNGFVDKYIGDAVMALFEKADDAIACGKELYNDIVLNPETAKELNVSSINIGIGIHTGMARIGIVGEEERMSGTVISNTVNLSSRLESLTKQYNTAMIITKDTLDKMEDPDSLNLRYLGMIQVAGVNEVKALYEVLDCLDEDRYVDRFKTKAEFREAVRLYHLGELKKSLGMFKSIKENSKFDPCLDIYINYIDKMIKEDNTDHNVFKFSRK